MQAKIKKAFYLDETTQQKKYILPITVADAVYVEPGKNLSQKLIELGSGNATPGGSVPLGTQQSSTFNLFDKSTITSPSTGTNDTLLIPIKEGYYYTFGSVNTQYWIYDVNQVQIANATSTTVKIPAGGRFLKVRIYGGQTGIDNFMLLESNYVYSTADYIPYRQDIIPFKLPQGLYKSQWYAKRWWVLGDSISTGLGTVLTTNFANKPYHYLLSNERFIHVQADATSGYTIGNIYDNKVVNMPPTEYSPDLITIMAGTNDHGFNIALGTINDDPAAGTTFFARYKKTVEYLLSRFPLATIGLITPIQRKTSTLDGNTANAAGFTLRQYVDAIIAIGNFYSIPVLNLYDNLGFSPYNATQNTNYYVNGDGTHPNNLGHLRMKARIGDFIERI